MLFNKEYVVNFLADLLNTPSPTGDTSKAIALVDSEFKKMGIKTYKTSKNALVATIDGQNTSYQKTLSGHVDTLGGMVKDIKPSGRIIFTQLGGYAFNAVEGEYCTISTSEGKEYTGTILINKASTHVHGAKTKSTERSEENMEIRLDEVVKSDKDTKDLGIDIGDFVYLNPRVEITDSGFIKSRHLDDKAGIASIMGACKYITENNIKLPHTVNLFISNYEEVGHGASSGIPENTKEFVAIDMAALGEGQSSDEYNVTICAKDSSGPYDFELRKKLIKLAKDNNLDYKVDIYPFYGSDASAAMRAGGNFKHGLIGPGVDASHSLERTHVNALENTTKLCIAYMMDQA
ncbi:M42 family metallopeptidase [Clostridiaceae bacterium M8S5]|nr:M42 family metallopeptidase [Clostridiaceae bacterium M8S5]